MRTTLGVMAAMLALPAASFGLSTTIGVQWADGSPSKSLALPGALGNTGVTVVLSSDQNLSGIQYAILASYDADGAGPGPAVDASALFQYTAAVNQAAKGNPFAGASKLHDWTTDNGVFDTAFDTTIFLRTDYTAGFGPNAVTPTAVPVTLAGAAPDVIFRTSGETEAIYIAPADAAHNKVVTYQIASVGELLPGTYTLSIGDKAGLGFKACNNTAGCVNASSGVTSVLTVLPEPASALLLLAAVPFLRRRRA